MLVWLLWAISVGSTDSWFQVGLSQWGTENWRIIERSVSSRYLFLSLPKSDCLKVAESLSQDHIPVRHPSKSWNSPPFPFILFPYIPLISWLMAWTRIVVVKLVRSHIHIYFVSSAGKISDGLDVRWVKKRNEKRS